MSIDVSGIKDAPTKPCVGSTWSGVNHLAIGGQRYLDVAARGVGVRANLMRSTDQLCCLG